MKPSAIIKKKQACKQAASDLLTAAESGDLLQVKALIVAAGPQFSHSAPLTRAARKGHLDVVQVLILVSDPKFNHSAPLYWASKNGHLDVVRVLISVSDPMVRDSQPLRVAAKSGDMAIMAALIPVSKIKSAVARLIFDKEWEAADTLVFCLAQSEPQKAKVLVKHHGKSFFPRAISYMQSVHRERRAIKDLPASLSPRSRIRP